MSWGIEVRSADDVVQLTSEASSLLFVDYIEHIGSAGVVYAWPELTGRQIMLMAVPYVAWPFFTISYPGGVPTVTTTTGEWGSGMSSQFAYVFAQ